MYSITRRLERYTILYTWKSLMGLVPDCGFQLHDESCDSKLRIPTLAKSSGRVRTLKEGSFRVTGVKLYNSLPSSLRSLRSVPLETFKRCLDSFLSIIPDEPATDKLVPPVTNITSGKPSNSIIDVINANKGTVNSFNQTLHTKLNNNSGYDYM